MIKFIESVEDTEKRNLFYSVYLNNQSYAVNKSAQALLGRIIKAMNTVDRKNFVLPQDKPNAYFDVPLPIGHGQTISQPTTVARMLLLSALKKGMDVLEVGSGSGWNACLTAHLVYPGKVVSVERIKPLSELAKRNLKSLDNKIRDKMNLEFVYGSALNKRSKIWKKEYNLIIITAAASKELVDELKKISKLKENGNLLFPTQSGSLELWRSKKGVLHRGYIDIGYAFVPLIR